jgi:predicted dehydrogenase
MKNGKYQVGLIGCGGIARDQHLPGWARVPFVEVAALADISGEALAQATALAPGAQPFSDWQQLLALDHLDIIDVCTPNRTHTAIVLAALARGCHVLCEKPLATTSREAQAMADAALASRRVLMAAQHLRFDPVAVQLHSLVAGGRLGEVYYTRAQWLRRRLLPARLTFISRALSGGGPAVDIGVHVLDLAYWLLGAPEPVSVSAFQSDRLARRPDLGGAWGDWDRACFDVEDFAAGLVRFANGSVLVLEASWLGFQPEREIQRVQCYGTEGGLLWPDGLVVGETNRVPWDLKLHDTPRVAPHHVEIAEFARAVRDGGPCSVPMHETCNVIRILEAFYESAELGAEVRL